MAIIHIQIPQSAVNHLNTVDIEGIQFSDFNIKWSNDALFTKTIEEMS